jgi:hypothetical protein
MSDEVHTCPSCGADRAYCALCGGRVSVKDAQVKVPNFSIWSPSTRTKTYHESCIVPHFTVPADYRCPKCSLCLSTTEMGKPGYALAKLAEEKPGYDPDLTCPGCGDENPFQRVSDCSLCNLPIYVFQKHTNLFASIEDYERFRSLSEYPSGVINERSTAHDFCLMYATRLRQDLAASKARGGGCGVQLVIAFGIVAATYLCLH